MSNERSNKALRGFRTHGGASVPHRKNTAEIETVKMPAPEKLTLAMQQHLGAPCVPTVKVGDHVDVGQVVGDSDKFVSAPIHSPVSGKVTAITDIKMPSGQKVQAVVIENDGQLTVHESVKPPVINNKDEFIKAVRASGLVGLGGAGFPAFIKLNPPADAKIDTLVINGAECEPYITADYRECMENSWDIMSGVYAISQLLGVDRVVIGIENNKPEAIEVLTKIADNSNDPDDKVKVMTLPSRYPQGAEKVLIQKTTGRVVPKGKLPSDVGVVVMNVTSIAFLARYMKTGMPLVTKRLTIDGSAIKSPKNVEVCIGTPIKDVIEFAGGYKEQPSKILMGGPMMGTAVSDDSSPILKQNNAILAFDEKEAKLGEPTACIRCGKCVAACPMNLMPTSFDKMVAHGAPAEELDKAGAMVCMECGCCSFVCPAGRRLVQSMRLAKNIIRNAPKKEDK